MKLVFGLGNPGRAYARTRHNVGFDVIDRLCARRGVEADKRQLEALLGFAGQGDAKVGLVKPQTYMNLSGRAIRALLGYYKVEVEDILLVCDDLALPPGRLRLRRSGSSGGQKGVQSAIDHLGTQGFARLRIGIGQAPPHMDAADYVLARIPEEEQATLAAAIEAAADCVELWIAEGPEAAMQRFNQDPDAALRAPREAPAPREASAGANGPPKPRPSPAAGDDGA